MSTSVHGIHHVTAIAGDAQENLNFYAGVLGMRLVKRSVNQDAPDTYHLFYADGAGTPGTDLTFFSWPGAEPTHLGTGLIAEVPLAVPPGSLAYWRQRFGESGVQTGETETRFGETTLPFTDPHGLRLALVETGDERPFVVWQSSPVPPDFQVRGMHAVTLWEREIGPTETLLARLGFTLVGAEGDRRRYGVDGGGSGKLVEVRELPNERRGRGGTGGVHHVAWRTNDVPEEMTVRATIEQTGIQPTPLIDRFWFQSVYFKEPGGVLFELATDGPGFGVDEDIEHLGEQLVLPPWLEPQRAVIEGALPPLRMPNVLPEKP